MGDESFRSESEWADVTRLCDDPVNGLPPRAVVVYV